MNKRTYISPAMTSMDVAPMQVLAISIDDTETITNPDEYEILSRDNNASKDVPDLWNEKW